jgi:hypothetical protein
MRSNIVIICFLILSINAFSQNLIFNDNGEELPKKIRLKIATDREIYKLGDTIWVDYTFLNISDSTQEILIKEYWNHPMGMTASILDENDSSICKYPTKTYYSSTIFLEKDLKDYYKRIEPNSKITGKVALQSIPAFKDYIKNGLIPKGKYTVNLGYYILLSNTIGIQIK